MSYLHENFLLPNKTAQRLFHEVAAGQPIMDYHCHLPPEDIAGNARFPDLAQVWLGGDHYKWRAMRAAGEPESLITGKDSSPKEKFDAWARTLPQTVRNPLHHWAHLELKRYFDCDLVLSPKTADEIWELANARLSEDSFNVHNICKQFDIRAVGTTDDPVDDLQHHIAFNGGAQATKMFPTFRPDKGMITANLEAWNSWTDQLANVSGQSIDSAADFMSALKSRHDFFHDNGCRLTDHGLEACPFVPCSDRQAEVIFKKLRSSQTPTADEAEQWMTFLMQAVARWNTARGWTMQLHLGPIRNNNSKMFKQLGPDTGYDAMLDEPVARKTVAFLDSLVSADALPKTIFYHINPSFLYPFATLMGSYQDGSVPGKMQLGSGWWHVDTLDGMRTQIDVLSSVGLLSKFVGMLTDSRSFLSFPRHEYFRRLVCSIIGTDVEAGLIPNDTDLLDTLIADICYNNAKNYFNFPGVK
ncbi:MAG: glucuronate isomerase [Puniceicoccaceae bacterium]|nr:glucuronate isomerase [Puniceicoccaceae bacterium]|tara:strand:- start:804 stop:2216 length:1413 start_codon:yes stop_codon:yes gene_type:complete